MCTEAENRVLTYWQDERYRRQLPNAMFHASDENPVCGDELSFDISIKDSIITEIGFSGEACTLTVATAAMLCEQLDGKAPFEIDPIKLIGVPVNTNRKQCVLLPWRILKNVLFPLA